MKYSQSWEISDAHDSKNMKVRGNNEFFFGVWNTPTVCFAFNEKK